jgi:hypothetical protein
MDFRASGDLKLQAKPKAPAVADCGVNYVWIFAADSFVAEQSANSLMS